MTTFGFAFEDEDVDPRKTTGLLLLAVTLGVLLGSVAALALSWVIAHAIGAAYGLHLH